VRTRTVISKCMTRTGDPMRQPNGICSIWEMDAEGGVEQMGDYDGAYRAGSAPQSTGHVHMDRGLPH
jgi:hypothetical protein